MDFVRGVIPGDGGSALAVTADYGVLLRWKDIASFFTRVFDDTSSSLLFGAGFNDINLAIGGLRGSSDHAQAGARGVDH